MAQVHGTGRKTVAYEVTDVAAFLASSEASYVTGAAINVNGGMDAQGHETAEAAPAVAIIVDAAA